MGTVFLVGTIGVLTYRRARQTYVGYPFPGFSVKILKKTIIYKIDETGVLNFSRKVVLQALNDNVDRYVDKFVWTGGKSDLPRAGAGVAEVRRMGLAGIWTWYDSRLEKSLRKGETTEITTHWPPLTNWRESSSFVSASSDEPTECIVFDITIPPCFLKDDHAILEEMRSIESKSPFSSDEEHFDDNGNLSWSITAKCYRHYRLRWSWKDGEESRAMNLILSDRSEL